MTYTQGYHDAIEAAARLIAAHELPEIKGARFMSDETIQEIRAEQRGERIARDLLKRAVLALPIPNDPTPDAGWRRITDADCNSKRMLVTNNINGRDATGGMSHVWFTFILKPSDPSHGPYTSFDDSNRRLCGLTHCCALPDPASASKIVG
jgi:hypothetical protein